MPIEKLRLLFNNSPKRKHTNFSYLNPLQNKKKKKNAQNMKRYGKYRKRNYHPTDQNRPKQI